ncbi:MAG: biotin--[Ruminococcus sp.]|nr:biotin--[acetyl-CoA-carboxylase] ligase [Ruminococcus sp.]
MTFNVIKLKETESTNTYAKALLRKGEPLMPYTLIYTSRQTAGRGRLGRSWESEEGSTLCMSLVAPYPYAPAVTLLSALGVHRALCALGVKNTKIKWPNDLIFGNKKLCGILTESTDKYAVIGIGINLNTEDFPLEIAHKATSLKMITGKVFDPFEAAKLITQKLVEILEETKGSLTPAIHREYTALCENIGREVSFRGKSGVAVAIDKDGSLLVQTAEGTEKISSGEVFVCGIY